MEQWKGSKKILMTMKGFDMTSKKDKVKTFEEQTVVCAFDQVNSEDFSPPAKFCFKNSFGDTVFVKARGRAKCQEVVDLEYGKGKFRVWDSNSF